MVGAGVLVLALLMGATALTAIGSAGGPGGVTEGRGGEADGVSALALREIPPEYLRLYQAGGAALRA